jgi:flagellar basal body rod protein FlgF
MALPNVTGTVIATGASCHVRVRTENGIEPIAFVASFQANEDFQVQDAVCLGNLGPIALDPQGYTCSITLDGFLPAKGKLDGAIQYADGGKISMVDKVPDREEFTEAAALTKFEYLDFYNKKAGKVLASFIGVLITSFGINAEGNSYVRNNVQMRALSMNVKN